MTQTFKKIKDPRIEAKIQKILSDPVETPTGLTGEEAIALVEAGRGDRPSLPDRREYARGVWGDL